MVPCLHKVFQRLLENTNHFQMLSCDRPQMTTNENFVNTTEVSFLLFSNIIIFEAVFHYVR